MTKGPQTIDGTPAGDQLAASPAYQQTLYEANTQGASAALKKSGASFIAVPDEPVKDNPLPQTRVVQAPTLPVANTVAAAPAPAETKTETRIETKIILPRPTANDRLGGHQAALRPNEPAGRSHRQGGHASGLQTRSRRRAGSLSIASGQTGRCQNWRRTQNALTSARRDRALDVEF